jgi:cytochrome b561
MTETYDTRTIALHWASAALVLCLWIVAQSLDFFPKGMPRTTALSVHITLGLLLVALLAVRVAWRLSGGTRLAAADTGVLGRLAVGAHRLLYGLLCAAVIAGVACVWIRGDTWFNIVTVTALAPGDKSLRHNAVELHGLIANALLALAAVHSAAAAWHHSVRKDGVLRRMWPALQVNSLRR